MTHPNGPTTHVVIDDFTDPWKPSETILIQPGFGRHYAFWYHRIPVLARHYRVVRRDLRGHGLSSCPGPDYDYSLDTILGEIADTLDQLGLEKVHILGESTGGMIAVAFAGKFPDRCHSLITCATPTHLPESFQKEQAQGRKDWETACRTMGSKAIMRGLSSLPGGIGQPDPEYSKWWMEQVSLTRGEDLLAMPGS
jgi:pimeloyl-ACP methyl ester carboxylesterase